MEEVREFFRTSSAVQSAYGLLVHGDLLPYRTFQNFKTMLIINQLINGGGPRIFPDLFGSTIGLRPISTWRPTSYRTFQNFKSMLVINQLINGRGPRENCRTFQYDHPVKALRSPPRWTL